MATSLLLSPLSAPSIHNSNYKSSFVHNNIIYAPLRKGAAARVTGRCFRLPVTAMATAGDKSLDYIPQQFRQGNLKDGLMDNFQNVPRYLYGLSPSQMDMFMTEDIPETISSSHNYLNHGGMWSLSGMHDKGPAKYSMSVSMYRGGGRAAGRPRSAPPDLPSLLLDARICYLGMPIVPAVTELLVAQFMWLDYDNPSKPIYLYINSSGTQNDKMETVGSETEAYAIADIMAYCKSDVYTVNCGMAFGQAAMLLSLGTKGYRAMQPNSSTKLYLPKANRTSGAAIDMWIKAKELDTNTDYFLELLEKGIGKPKDEINKDIMRPKYFQAQEAIDYGIADKIISSRDNAFDKRNYDELLAQSKAARRGAGGGGTLAAPSGFRYRFRKPLHVEADPLDPLLWKSPNVRNVPLPPPSSHRQTMKKKVDTLGGVPRIKTIKKPKCTPSYDLKNHHKLAKTLDDAAVRIKDAYAAASSGMKEKISLVSKVPSAYDHQGYTKK